jgi:cathepsin C
MMVELVNVGPFPVGYEVYSDFLTYKGGIYKHTGIADQLNAWMPVSHAVLVVGYGVENGIKYWIAQNSWGSEFGEGGYFRILKGTNEANFESLAAAATLIIPEHLNTIQ